MEEDEEVDEQTENWPVTAKLRNDLNDIKGEFKVAPLRVYTGDCLVRPEDVEEQIRGALVELRFELRHYCIRSGDYDSFNASIEQIVILQPGEARPASEVSKRKNVWDGPIRLNPAQRPKEMTIYPQKTGRTDNGEMFDIRSAPEGGGDSGEADGHLPTEVVNQFESTEEGETVELLNTVGVGSESGDTSECMLNVNHAGTKNPNQIRRTVAQETRDDEQKVEVVVTPNKGKGKA